MAEPSRTDVVACYRYYSESRKRNGNQPLPIHNWERAIYQGQVEEMVKYRCTIYDNACLHCGQTTGHAEDCGKEKDHAVR